MDSASLRLHHGALHIPSTACRAAGLARLYSSFSRPSLSLLSKASTYRSVSRHNLISSPVICALNKSSPPWPNYNKGDVKKIVRVVGMSTASVVLACVLGVINCNYIFSPNAIAARPIKHLRSSSTPGGGADMEPSFSSCEDYIPDLPLLKRPKDVLTIPKDVLESVLKVTRHLATPESRLRKVRGTFKLTPELSISVTPTPEDRERFKIAVADLIKYLIKSGMWDVAENQLINLYKEMVNKGAEPAKDVDMELVLVLILQGKYQEALQRECLREDTSTSDGRVYFYKAIIFTMLGRDYDAEKYWNKFVFFFSVNKGHAESPI